MEGEEATTGINVEETVYGKKGEVLTVRKYNTLDSTSVLCEEKEYAEDGTVCAEKDATGEHATTYTYAPDSGKLRASHYPSGATLAYGYEKDGSMSAITQSTEEGEENTTRLARTAGLVTELTSGNTTVRYEYDGKGRKTKVNVNGAEISYSYADHVTQNEKIVNKVSELRPSANSETVSDPHGNVLKTSVNGSTQFTASYNEKDLPTAVQDAAGNQSITYSYDAYDHLTRYEAVPNSASYTNAHAVTEEYAYTSEGLLAHKALSVDCNETVTEAYAYKDNAAKELDFITVGGTVRVAPAKDALGRSTGKAISFNGTKIAEEQITYLKVGDHATPLPATVRFGSPSSVSSNGYFDTRFGLTDCLKYKYDAMGNVTEVKENGRIAARYFYDAIGRLVREDNKPMGETSAFTYDNNGRNRSINGGPSWIIRSLIALCFYSISSTIKAGRTPRVAKKGICGKSNKFSL